MAQPPDPEKGGSLTWTQPFYKSFYFDNFPIRLCTYIDDIKENSMAPAAAWTVFNNFTIPAGTLGIARAFGWNVDDSTTIQEFYFRLRKNNIAPNPDYNDVRHHIGTITAPYSIFLPLQANDNIVIEFRRVGGAAAQIVTSRIIAWYWSIDYTRELS